MRKIILIFSVIMFAGCDSNSSKYTIEGIRFSKAEITKFYELGISHEYIGSVIKNNRVSGVSDKEIKKQVLSIKSVGFDIINYIEDTAREDKNRFYTACYTEYSKVIKTFDDREIITKFCNCAAECVMDNIKWVNNMPLSLSEEDEKDIGKVELAWVQLEKQCKDKCLKAAKPKK